LPTTFMSGRDFNQDIGRAKRAAESGPVIVTDRGTPSHVLLSHQEYCRLTGLGGKSIVDLLRQDGPEADFDFEPPRLGDSLKPADFS